MRPAADVVYSLAEEAIERFETIGAVTADA